jgi:hypothetical protein
MFACDVGLPAVAGATPRLNVTDCACKLCNSVEHTTPFCPLDLQQTDPTQTENKARNSFTDRYGRPRFYYEGKEICNNFNGSKGCPRPNCTFAHICSKCKARFDQSTLTLFSRNRTAALEENNL